MAPKSSIIASAVKKIFREMGILLPKRLKTPKEKAMSVAEGMAQPFNASGSPILNII